jgi:hypothetical protein
LVLVELLRITAGIAGALADIIDERGWDCCDQGELVGWLSVQLMLHVPKNAPAIQVSHGPVLFGAVSDLALLTLANAVRSFNPEIDSLLIIPDCFDRDMSQLLIQNVQQLLDNPAPFISVAKFIASSLFGVGSVSQGR